MQGGEGAKYVRVLTRLQHGCAPLYYAVGTYANEAIAKRLLAAGARVNQASDVRGRPAGLSPNVVQVFVFTALHVAAHKGNTWAVRLLVSHGAAVNATDRVSS